MSIFGIFFGSIPKPFWSEYSGKPFIKCIDCSVPLPECNTYAIQKRFVAGEAIFEMAMCERCREKMAAEFSEETRQNIANYIREQFQKLDAANSDETADTDDPISLATIEVRQIEEAEEGQKLLEQCMDFCVMCGAKRAECHRYSLMGLCRDDEIVVQVTPFGRTPLMICEKCESGTSELVSKQTRDSWDRFMEKHFDGPPGIESDSPTTYPVAF